MYTIPALHEVNVLLGQINLCNMMYLVSLVQIGTNENKARDPLGKMVYSLMRLQVPDSEVFSGSLLALNFFL